MSASWALIRAAAVMFAGTPPPQQYVVQTLPVAPTNVQSESTLQAWSSALTAMSTHTSPSVMTAASRARPESCPASWCSAFALSRPPPSGVPSAESSVFPHATERQPTKPRRSALMRRSTCNTDANLVEPAALPIPARSGTRRCQRDDRLTDACPGRGSEASGEFK